MGYFNLNREIKVVGKTRSRFFTAFIFLFLVSNFIPCKLYAQDGYTIKGIVVEKQTGYPIEQATVVLTEVNLWNITDEDGSFRIDKIIPGKYTLYVSYLGFSTIEKEILVESDSLGIVLEMEVLSLSMDEVVVTAKEQKLGASSKIEQTAIEHLQTKSVEDVLQLLPGGISENPSLGEPAQMRIREVGEIKNGQMSIDTDDNTSALGAAVIVDGTPLSTNSNMQVYSTSKSGTSTDIPGVAGKGIDLREITTDNIESIEVIRGIPSAEYGDLTSGAVIVKTKAGQTPYEAKIAIDPGTKIFSFGKGIMLRNDKGSVNTSFDYTTSYPDVRLKYEGYKRITSNLGYSNTFFRKSIPLSLNLKFAFHTTIDDEKTDPQLKSKEVIRANTNGLRTSLNGKWMLNKLWISNLSYNFSVSYSHQKDYQKELHTITAGSMPLATSYENGEHAASFIPSEYYSELNVDGKPFDVFAQIKGNSSFYLNSVFNNILVGAEWRANGNNGNGRTFDLNYPPSINSISTVRPRSYKDIPTLNTVSLFVEDKINIPVGKTDFSGQAGLRFSNTQPTGMFSTDGALTLEPRINLKYQVINNKNNRLFKELSFRAGYGIAAKTPTLIHLYPDKVYFDETSLNYKDETYTDGSLAVLTTQVIEDTSNPDLKPAKNRKKEIGFDFSLGNIKANITAYHEKQTGGYNYRKVPFCFAHREYSVEGSGKYPYFVEDEGVYYYEEGKIVKASSTMDTSFNFYNVPVNDYVLIKKGVEYVLNLGKLNILHTDFILDGALMYTESYNTLETYSQINDSYQGTSFPYVAVYPAGDKRIRQRFNTNIRTVTHIPAIKIVVSLTTQIIWFEKLQYKYENENGESYVYVTQNKEKIEVDDVYSYTGDNIIKNVDPVGYINKAGNYYAWETDNYLTQPYYKMLDTYSDSYFLIESYPPVVQFNLKLTKELANNLKIAFTANNFLNIRPYYKYKRASGYKKRNVPLYFGAEIMLKV